MRSQLDGACLNQVQTISWGSLTEDNVVWTEAHGLHLSTNVMDMAESRVFEAWGSLKLLYCL